MKRHLISTALFGSAALLSSHQASAQDPNIIVDGQALSKWKEAESDHFLIYSDGDEKYLNKLAGRLEAVHYLLKAATNMKEPADGNVVKVKVYAVGDIADVRRLIGDPQSAAAGYYDAQLAGPISVIPRNSGNSGSFSGELILFHEYAHHFMLQYQAAAYPAWYVEGFAEIIGTASFEKEGMITFGKAAKHREAEMRGTRRYPAAKMVDGSFMKEKPDAENWGYDDAWILAHYLTFSDKRKGQLGAYLRGINAGLSFAEAAKVFGDLNTLSRDLNVYIDGGSVPYKTPVLPPEVQKAPDIRQLTVVEAEFMEDKIVMERLARISTREEYDEWAKMREKNGDKVKKDFDTYYKEESDARAKWMKDLGTRVARFGNDPTGWAVKAHAECMAKDFAACRDSADRVLALKPDHWEGQLRKGQALIGLAKAAGDTEKAALAKEGRKWVLKANTSNPPAHEPLLLYYESFAAEGKRAPDDAVDSLAAVVATIPQIDAPRLMLGRELIARGQIPFAIKTLRPLAFSPHESPEQKKAQAMLAAIDKAAAGEDEKAEAAPAN
jgi:bifunctional DNA-binding transcriptional regulator/antitoxin component of YhaV-PrlF toxin-antitoxin module